MNNIRILDTGINLVKNVKTYNFGINSINNLKSVLEKRKNENSKSNS